MNKSYFGKILIIDLTNKKVSSEIIPEKVYKLLLGGKGVGTYLLYKMIPKNTEPLSEDNVIIFGTGPLTGTSAPTSSRCVLLTKSPATKFLLDSYCGGFLGQIIKYTGQDFIIIKGKANKKTILVINNDEVSFLDGEDLIGLTTEEKDKKIKEKLGKDFAVVVIGPAGERGSKIAGVFSDSRTFGRGGAGAVMGSKNLLGIAIKGNKKLQVNDADEFEYAVWVANRNLRMNTAISRLKERGTANILELINSAGGLPTKNFSLGQFIQAEEIDGKNLKKKLWKRNKACFNCPISCTKIAVFKKDEEVIELDGPEYETIFALGSCCMVSDIKAISYANYLCDLYGIDTMSTGVIIAYIMELHQKGYISKKDLDGIPAVWSSGDALIKLVEKMGKGEGCGKLLEQGVKDISEKYPDSKNFAMHSKGLELPGYLPQAAKGIGLAYAISERGGCHLHGAPLNELMGGADPLTVEGKAELVKVNQCDVEVIDSTILCYFVKFGFTIKEIFEMINPATGLNYSSPKGLEELGERIINLARIFNIREGLTKKDDCLPERCVSEPLSSGPAKGHFVPLEKLLEEYYNLMGWDKDGVPKKDAIKELKEIL